MKKVQTGLQCHTCGAEIYSNYRHDFQGCDCEVNSDTYIYIDGGWDYCRVGRGEKADCDWVYRKVEVKDNE